MRLLFACVGAQWVGGSSLLQGREARELEALALANAGKHTEMSKAQEYVQALARKNLLSDYTLTGQENTSLDIVEAFIKEIVNSTTTEHDEDVVDIQNELSAIQGCIDTAQNSLNTTVSLKNSSTNTGRDEHATCRTGQLSDATNETNKCLLYNSHRKSVAGPPSCIQSPLSYLSQAYLRSDVAAEKAHMESCLVEVFTWTSLLYHKFVACRDAGSTHTNKTISCKNKQLAFETAFCSYSEWLENTCNTQDTCYTEKKATAENMTNLRKVSESRRKADFETAKFILCFFGIFRTENETLKTELFESCSALTTDTSNLTLPNRTIPIKMPCETELHKPCDNGWKTAEYTNEEWNSVLDECTPCPPPATTPAPTPQDLGEFVLVGANPPAGFQPDRCPDGYEQIMDKGECMGLKSKQINHLPGTGLPFTVAKSSKKGWRCWEGWSSKGCFIDLGQLMAYLSPCADTRPWTTDGSPKVCKRV